MRDKDISNMLQKRVQCFSRVSTDHLHQSHPKCLLKMLIPSSISRPTGPESLEVGLGMCFFFFFCSVLKQGFIISQDSVGWLGGSADWAWTHACVCIQLTSWLRGRLSWDRLNGWCLIPAYTASWSRGSVLKWWRWKLQGLLRSRLHNLHSFTSATIYWSK